MKTMTREEIRNYKLTRSDKADLRRLALLPDNRIDTTDIPELGARRGWSCVRADRPVRRQLSIRLNDSDIVEAQRLAAAKGLPYDLHQIIASRGNKGSLRSQIAKINHEMAITPMPATRPR